MISKSVSSHRGPGDAIQHSSTECFDILECFRDGSDDENTGLSMLARNAHDLLGTAPCIYVLRASDVI